MIKRNVDYTNLASHIDYKNRGDIKYVVSFEDQTTENKHAVLEAIMRGYSNRNKDK